MCDVNCSNLSICPLGTPSQLNTLHLTCCFFLMVWLLASYLLVGCVAEVLRRLISASAAARRAARSLAALAGADAMACCS